MAPRLAATDKLKPRLVVALDLDETLVHSMLEESDSEDHSEEKGGDRGVESFRIQVEDERFLVNKRPGLHNFLRKASQLYTLYVYTAGAKDYAEKVLGFLDPARQFFHGCFYRQACIEQDGDYLKDLTLCPWRGITKRFSVALVLDARIPSFHPISGVFCSEIRSRVMRIVPLCTQSPSPPVSAGTADGNLERVVLVDNNYVSFTMQPANGISIRNFIDDPNDVELDVLLQLLREVNKFPDVRAALKRARANCLIGGPATADM